MISTLEVTGDGSAKSLATLGITALSLKWVEFKAGSSNSATIRIGGPNVSATVGFPLDSTEAQMFPLSGADPNHGYAPSAILAYIAAADVLNILYEA